MAVGRLAGGPELVAHRGYPRHYPENTLRGITAALEAGAEYVELDVQLSGDGIPVLLHDEDLARTAGVEGAVTQLPLACVRELDVSETTRLNGRFRDTRIPTLAEVTALLGAWLDLTVFVEIKPESITRFGGLFVVDQVIRVLGVWQPRCVIVCSHAEAVAQARARGAAPVGWVIEDFSDETRSQARSLGPQYLFCDHQLLPETPEPLWPGPWRWVVYEVDRADQALALARRGADFIETMAFGEILGELRLSEDLPDAA